MTFRTTFGKIMVQNSQPVKVFALTLGTKIHMISKGRKVDADLLTREDV